uniref:Uncharacterized protein n=1 Tax=Panagrolaimus sp. ES5 TaxID=591445 RepID=A0AC34GWX8_9BILA
MIPHISLDEDTDNECDQHENPGMTNERVYCIVCFKYLNLKHPISCSSNHKVCESCFRKTAYDFAKKLSYDELIKGFSCSEWKCKSYIDYETSAKYLPKKTRQLLLTQIFEVMLRNADVKAEKYV